MTPAQFLARQHVGIVLRQIEADGEELLVVRLARLVHVRIAERVEAAMPRVHRGLALDLGRLAEEVLALGVHRVDHRFRHAVVGDVEEPIGQAGIADRLRRALRAGR